MTSLILDGYDKFVQNLEMHVIPDNIISKSILSASK